MSTVSPGLLPAFLILLICSCCAAWAFFLILPSPVALLMESLGWADVVPLGLGICVQRALTVLQWAPILGFLYAKHVLVKLPILPLFLLIVLSKCVCMVLVSVSVTSCSTCYPTLCNTVANIGYLISSKVYKIPTFLALMPSYINIHQYLVWLESFLH